MLNMDEKEYYAKHLLLEEIGEKGQKALKQAKVLIVGSGGLGCPVLSYLSGSGIGKIGIIDGDNVNVSNLQRQTLFMYADVGKNKAITAAIRVREINPFISVEYYNEYLNVKNALDIIKLYDIVVDATDNFPSRYLINDACVQLGKPFVFASIDKFQGQLSVFNYSESGLEDGPTYRCVFPDPPSPDMAPNCSELGVLGVLPGVLGSLQANEVIKMITGAGKVLSGKILITDLLNTSFYTIKIERDINVLDKIIKINSNTDASIYKDFCSTKINSELNIDPDEIDNLADYIFIDVRDNGHLRGIRNSLKIPASKISSSIDTFNDNKKYILFCDYGITSQKVTTELLKKGIKNIYNLKGGLQKWNYEKFSKEVV